MLPFRLWTVPVTCHKRVWGQQSLICYTCLWQHPEIQHVSNYRLSSYVFSVYKCGSENAAHLCDKLSLFCLFLHYSTHHIGRYFKGCATQTMPSCVLYVAWGRVEFLSVANVCSCCWCAVQVGARFAFELLRLASHLRCLNVGTVISFQTCWSRELCAVRCVDTSCWPGPVRAHPKMLLPFTLTPLKNTKPHAPPIHGVLCNSSEMNDEKVIVFKSYCLTLCLYSHTLTCIILQQGCVYSL